MRTSLPLHAALLLPLALGACGTSSPAPAPEAGAASPGTNPSSRADGSATPPSGERDGGRDRSGGGDGGGDGSSSGDGGSTLPADDIGRRCERPLPASFVGCAEDPDAPARCCEWSGCRCVGPLPGDRDGDGTPDEEDCAPLNRFVHPGAEEIQCNGLDDDCSGGDDCPPDRDGDGWRADRDCDDTNPNIHPNATEILCNGIDEDCSVGDNCCVDMDGDGIPVCTDDRGSFGDCDDTHANAYPGYPEIPCDGVDNDCQHGDCCDNDDDGDGVPCRLDCDDQNPLAFPGRTPKPGDCFCFDANCDGIPQPHEEACCPLPPGI